MLLKEVKPDRNRVCINANILVADGYELGQFRGWLTIPLKCSPKIEGIVFVRHGREREGCSSSLVVNEDGQLSELGSGPSGAFPAVFSSTTAHPSSLMLARRTRQAIPTLARWARMNSGSGNKCASLSPQKVNGRLTREFLEGLLPLLASCPGSTQTRRRRKLHRGMCLCISQWQDTDPT